VEYALGFINKSIQGRLYVGRVSGSIFTGLFVDTVEIRDKNDSLFVAAANVSVEYDPRDLIDRRLLLRHVRAGRVTANIFEDSIGMLNFRPIFPSGPPGRGGGAAASDGVSSSRSKTPSSTTSSSRSPHAGNPTRDSPTLNATA
jgi:hypothetical protein